MCVKYEVLYGPVMRVLEFNKEVISKKVIDCRWPKKISCPHKGCGSTKHKSIPGSNSWQCLGSCKKRFTVKTNTIFSNSKLTIEKIYMSAFVISFSKKMSREDFKTLTKIKSNNNASKLMTILKRARNMAEREIELDIKYGPTHHSAELILNALFNNFQPD